MKSSDSIERDVNSNLIGRNEINFVLFRSSKYSKDVTGPTTNTLNWIDLFPMTLIYVTCCKLGTVQKNELEFLSKKQIKDLRWN